MALLDFALPRSAAEAGGALRSSVGKREKKPPGAGSQWCSGNGEGGFDPERAMGSTARPPLQVCLLCSRSQRAAPGVL